MGDTNGYIFIEVPIEIEYSVHRTNVDTIDNTSNNETPDSESEDEGSGMLDSISNFTSESLNSVKGASTETYGSLKNYITEEFTFTPVTITANGKCFKASETLSACP